MKLIATQPRGSATSSRPGISRQATLTSEASLTCEPTISEATPNATSSPELEGGHEPSDLPDGQTTDLFGLVPVPANPSAQPEKVRRPMTNAICGLRGFLSSESYALQQSLESRLRRQLDGAGSTLFSLIWKAKATPAGRPYCQLAASALRTSDNGFGSWPTTRSSDADKGVRSEGGALRERERRKNGADLPSVAMGAWPTPMAGTPAQKGYNEAGNNDSSRKTVALVTGQLPTQDRKTTATQLGKSGEKP